MQTRQEKGSGSKAVSQVDICGGMGQQHLHNLDVVSPGSVVEGREVVELACLIKVFVEPVDIKVRIVPQQRHHFFNTPILCCTVQLLLHDSVATGSKREKEANNDDDTDDHVTKRDSPQEKENKIILRRI